MKLVTILVLAFFITYRVKDLMVADQPPPPQLPVAQPEPTPTPTQTPSFKYFCRICKRGFGCGRALGGHMRAHGIGDESLQMNDDDDDDQVGDWDDKSGGTSHDVLAPGNRRMYALRTNPNRVKSCRVCENCGKEFVSWNSFLEHVKYCGCDDDDVESLVPSPDHYEDEDDVHMRGAAKRKRSVRLQVDDCNNSKCPITEEEDLANCLMMLANATTDDAYLQAPEAEDSCTSASKEDYERHNDISYATPISYRARSNHMKKAKGVASRGLFECKACKKVFNSHQALGGHRASHKKVKGCFAARLDNDYLDPNLDHRQENALLDEEVITHEEFTLLTKPSSSASQYDQHVGTNSLSASKKKSKVHECSICHRTFSSGQALGGHKRCHWITSNAPDASTSLANKFHQFHDPRSELQQQQQPHQNHNYSPLDLNLSSRRDRAHRLSFELSTEIQLQPPWAGDDHKDTDIQSKNNDDNYHNDIINNSLVRNNDMNSTQEDCKAELAKLSDLKDTSGAGSSSPWLQVGLGSTTNIGADL